MLFSHEDWVRIHIKMTLLGIELGTLEVKGEWSDHYATDAPVMQQRFPYSFVLKLEEFCIETRGVLPLSFTISGESARHHL